MKAYPITFEPILIEKIWGGSKLRTVLNKKTTEESIGESWEISGVAGHISVVNKGAYKGLSITSLVEKFNKDFVGFSNYERFGNEFPLLIKFLDANQNLSIQVHPDDTIAKQEHNSFGKTEMWYVMDHEEDAEIILGLKDKNVDMDILQHVEKSNVYDVFNTEKVKKGDAYFIPAGKVHAIGAGVVIAEIQQTSDITYRVYDWERTNSDGQPRELHLLESIKATKETSDESKKEFTVKTNASSNVVDCDYFTTNILKVQKGYRQHYGHLDSFVILMCVVGSASVTVNGITEVVSKGETVLLPATTNEAFLFAEDAEFLEVYISE